MNPMQPSRTFRRYGRTALATVQALLAVALLLAGPGVSPALAAGPIFTNPFAPFGLADVGDHAAPTFADIDGDGDLDVFIGNSDGNTLYFQNTGSALNPAFAAAVANPFGLANVGIWAVPTFADIDGDGDLDAFIGNGDGNTLYFQNTGSAASPAFAAASANPFGLADVGFLAALALADIDGDGDLDVFIGNFDGDTLYFQNTGSAASPAFAAAVTNPFGLADVGSYSHPTFADIDGDGDQDALIGNYDGNTLYFQNTGSALSPAFAAAVANPFGLANVDFQADPPHATPALADIDGDGDLDAFIGNGDGKTYFFRNIGGALSPAFVSPFAPFGLTDVGNFASPTFADIDGDGDLDAFIGNSEGNTLYFQNTGSALSPAFAAAVANPFGLTDVGSYAHPTLADIDGDGDLDAFIGNFDGNTLYFQNTGSALGPAFAAAVANPFGLANVGSWMANPTFADIDGDGDLDAFIGNFDGNMLYFQNTGSAASPAFAAAVANPFGLTDVGDFAFPTFADLDGDGDQDAFIGNAGSDILFFRNTGSAASPAFAAAVANPFGLADGVAYAAPTLVDIDGDGDLDALIGKGQEGNTFYFENLENLPDLALLKTVQPTSAAPGSAITYTLAFSNTGRETACQVVITDSLPVSLTQALVSSSGVAITQTAPGYVWAVADLAGGQVGVITITGVLSLPLASGSFTNTAAIAALSDAVASNNTASAGVTVLQVAPQAADDTAAVDQNSIENVLDVLANDSDANGDSLSMQAVGSAAHGMAMNNGDTIRYTPQANFSGVDVFTYTVSDGALTDTAQVTVTVISANNAPLAVDDVYTATRNTLLVVAAPGVLGNDGDADGDALTAISNTQPAHGSASVSAAGGFMYMPGVGFFGVDGFTYTVSDGALTSTARVTVTVSLMQQHTLRVGLAGDGLGAVTSEPVGIDCGELCAANYSSDTVITLTAAPSLSSTFTGWSGRYRRPPTPSRSRWTRTKPSPRPSRSRATSSPQRQVWAATSRRQGRRLFPMMATSPSPSRRRTATTSPTWAWMACRWACGASTPSPTSPPTTRSARRLP